MSRLTWWGWARLLAGTAVLVALVARLGAEPFLDGLRRTSVWALAAATAITALTTLCCVWRWTVIAHRLGRDLHWRTGLAAYYRSQFLNSTLPGGVVGDVERAVRHDLRSVVWERGLGQATQITLTLAVLLVLPSPFRGLVATPVVVAGASVLLLVALAVGRRVSVVLVPGTLPPVVLASALAVAGHCAVFLVAVRSAGVTIPAGEVLPLSLVVLLGAAVPANVAGWGPREGVAAWAFAAAGLGAAQGVTVAVVYGVLSLVATLPGVVVMAIRRKGSRPMEVARG